MYYRIHLIQGKFKKKQFYRTIFVQIKDSIAIDGVYIVIRKIPFARLIYAKRIDRETYIKGVSASVS